MKKKFLEYLYTLIWIIRFLRYSYLSSLRGKSLDVISEVSKKYIRSGDLVIDIGANNGMSALMFSSLVKKTGHVICYEPNYQHFKNLDYVSKNNLYKNIEIRKCGLSNKIGKAEFYIDKRNGSQASTFDKEFYLKEKNIRGDIFDKSIANLSLLDKEKIGNVKFIKIDTEGFELEILKGGIETIKLNKPIILFEFFFDDSDPHFLSKKIELFNLFETIFYELTLINIFFQKNKIDTLNNSLNSKISKEFSFPTYVGVDILALPQINKIASV